MNEPLLMSPTFPTPVGISGGAAVLGRRLLMRKTVDYHASTLHYLENRLWQRDKRDIPLIQPDSTYYNEVATPHGMTNIPVNAVTTKFVKACTNKARSPIFSTAWVPDGRRLITGAASGEFTLWNGINFNFESIIQAHDCSVRSMKWSHNGKWMVTTDDRGFVKYWQINFNNVHTFQAHSEPIRSSSFSPTDSKLATCSDDGTVRIFDFLCCTEEHILRGHGADVKSLDWHPRKSLLASGSKDNQQPVKLWDPKSGHSVCTIHAHKATVMDLKWNQNGNWLATASRDYLIKLFDIRAMKELAILKGHKKDVNTLSWHPVHEKLFASGGSDGAVLFWLVGNDREVGGMESAHEGFVWSLSWHPLGHLLCSGANDHTCKFWCRNRPGEELKDKYNSFHNPYYLGDEMDTMASYNLPGMGVVNDSGLPQHVTDAVTLPPPSSGDVWKSRNMPPDSGPLAPSSQVSQPPPHDVPVLGADIIAETFADKSGPPFHQNGPIEVKNEFHGHPPPHPGGIRPLLGDVMPPGGYRDQKEMDGEWRRPGSYGNRHPEEFGNRYSWHNPDYPRRPSLDEERWNHNPYVYRPRPNDFTEPRRPPPGPYNEPRGPPPQGPRRPSGDFGYRPPSEEQFMGRQDYPPPPGDRERQFGGPPPLLGERERLYGGPPPSGERPYGGPPPSGERPYGGPPPLGERPYGGPPSSGDRDRPYGSLPPPVERPYSGPPPSGDRERPYGGPPLSGDRDRPYGGPPPSGDRDRPYGGPPPSGDRERPYGGPPTSGDRPYGGPGDRERPYGGPPPSGDRPYGGPLPPGDRDRPYGGVPIPGDRDRPYGGPPPPGDRDRPYGPPGDRDRTYGGQPPSGDRDRGLPQERTPSEPWRPQHEENRMPPFHPQDPRQPPPSKQWQDNEDDFRPQDPRQAHDFSHPSDPRQRGISGHVDSFPLQSQPGFSHTHYQSLYTSHDGSRPYQHEPGHHSNESHPSQGLGKPDGPSSRDPRFERRGAWPNNNWRDRENDRERRREEHDDRDRRRDTSGRGKGKKEDDPRQSSPSRRRNSSDDNTSSAKRSKRDIDDKSSRSSSRGHSKKK